ncbi:MAG: MarR family transcriptional regulator [Chloroflexi bacterium]|nr:MarR family transcriptional regulator [Chloroflexota bacterium]
MRILRTVKNSPGIGIKELATSLSITSSAATQQVDNLVRKGYLTRKANTEDRRSLNLRLSANLSNRLEEIETAFIEEMIGRFGVLSDDELAAYAELNRRIANTILEK